jgi:hypothetical protein
MTVRVLRLGSDRIEGEGLRIGTVRRPPRGVPKEDFSSQNWYDVWFPNLSPSPETMKIGKNGSTVQRWLLLKTLIYWNCWQPCLITRTSLWDVTARRRHAAIVRC